MSYIAICFTPLPRNLQGIEHITGLVKSLARHIVEPNLLLFATLVIVLRSTLWYQVLALFSLSHLKLQGADITQKQ